ncbi:hypothetical protein Tco_0955615 [Tanacetum coccineum]|uniref:Uncharacterized protein n=1 Tax=Tanacetum coccineum TaxID=301880 RepID=A0ABQ5E7P9_9ASTR
MTYVHISSSLVLNQMTSDHNRSELGIQDHSNEQSSSKLVPKVVPLAMLRTTGINPMIQPEPEDLPKDNPKLEIAVLRYTRYQLTSLSEIVDMIGGKSAPSTPSTKTKMHLIESKPRDQS